MITWTIDNLTRRTSDGFITTAHWRATAVDDDCSVSVYGSCGWTDGDPVIPYPEVTKEQVLDWCWSNGVDKDEIENNLSTQIDELKHPKIESGVPW
jgi:hypothetical protein